MKLSIKPVAFAVTMALGAALAQAQTLPSVNMGGTPYDNGSNDGLYLAVWDNTSKATELVDLTSLYSDVAIGPIAGGSSILTTPTVGSNGWAAVSNFDGYASVDQLNLGTIDNGAGNPSFSSLFSSSSDYAVVAANNTKLGALSTAPLGFVFAGSPNNQASSIISDAASWTNAGNGTGPAIDANGTSAYNVVTSQCAASLCDGEENSGTQLAVNVGTAAGFYNWAKSGSSRNPTVPNTYSYDGQQGFFLLSTAGQLTWNLVTSTASTVPLPPAVWLFASGLLGLVAIGRRRQAGFGAAV